MIRFKKFSQYFVLPPYCISGKKDPKLGAKKTKNLFLKMLLQMLICGKESSMLQRELNKTIGMSFTSVSYRI